MKKSIAFLFLAAFTFSGCNAKNPVKTIQNLRLLNKQINKQIKWEQFI